MTPQTISLAEFNSAPAEARAAAIELLASNNIAIAEKTDGRDLLWALRQAGHDPRPAKPVRGRKATTKQIRYATSLIERARRDGDGDEVAMIDPARLATMTSAEVSAIIDRLR